MCKHMGWYSYRLLLVKPTLAVNVFLWYYDDRRGKAMEYIITAIITGGLSLLGVIITNASSNKKIEMQLMTSQAVTDAKIENLTDEVRKHNSFADRITKLEVKVDALEREVKYHE